MSEMLRLVNHYQQPNALVRESHVCHNDSNWRLSRYKFFPTARL